MSRLLSKSYEEFQNRNFNNFIGERINTELVEDLWGINANSNKLANNERLLNFKKANNLAYLGEVLERYEERGIVKSREDLRALLVYTQYSIMFESPEMNTNQLEVFISKVEQESIKNKDVFSIGILLSFCKFNQYIKEEKELCSIIIDEIENSSLDFEEKVWGMYSCWNYLNSIKEFTHSDNLLAKLNDVKDVKDNLLKVISGIEIEPLKHYEDYYLYLMLAEIGESEEFFKTSKNFKEKKVCNQYKKLISLLKKEYRVDNMESLTSVLNFNDEDVYLYNYLLSENAYLTGVTTKVTSKGIMRLYYEILKRLSSSKECSNLIMQIAESKIKEVSKQRDAERSTGYYKYSKGIKKAREIIFREFSGKVSVENFSKFIQLTDINKGEYGFFSSVKYSYIFDKEYSEIAKKINKKNIINLAERCLSRSESKEVVQKAYNYLSEIKAKDYIDEYQYKRLYALDILDSNSNSKYESITEMKGYFQYLVDTLSKEDLLKELKDFYNKFDDIEVMANEYIGKCSFVSKYTSVTLYALSLVNRQDNTFKEENPELAKEYQAFEDELQFFNLGENEYFYYIEKRLSDEDYVKLMGLTEDDVRVVLRNIYNYLKDNNDRYGNDYRVEGMLVRLEGKILTDDEKEEKAINKEIQSLEKRCRLYDIKYALEYDFSKTNKEYVSKVKEIFLEKVNASNVLTGYSSIRDAFEIVKMLVELEAFNDEELLEFSKTCLKNV